MTVAAAAAKAGPYTGNDSASAFDFAFKVFADTDIRVVTTVIATGVESDLVLNTNYTVARNVDQDTDPGGTVTYKVGGVTTAYPSTHKLTIVGDFVYEQPTDIPNGGAFFATVIENALDRLTMLIKQAQERLERAVTVDVSDTTAPDVLIDTLVASSAAAVQAAGDAQAAQALAEAAAANLPNAVTAGANRFLKTNSAGTAWVYSLLQSLNAGADIASAATIDLTAATGNTLRVTGTTPTSAVTMNAGQQMLVVADGLWPLTYHAAANRINTNGANYTCASGDRILYYKDGAGVVSGTILKENGSALTHIVPGLLDLSAAGAGQIKFPAAQNASVDANTLDDYEEGTWTPALGGTATYTSQAGHYTKIGREVIINGVLIVALIGTGSTTVITGLPFTSASTNAQGGVVTYYASSATSVASLTASIGAAEAQITMRSVAAGGGAGTGTSAIFGNSTRVDFKAVYNV